MQEIQLISPAESATIYAFPTDKSLDAWLTYRVLMVEGSGSNKGRYTAEIDQANGLQWVAFLGATKPATWTNAIPGVGWEVTQANIAGEIADAVVAAINADATQTAARVNSATSAAKPTSPQIVAAIKADADLGMAGMVADAAEIRKVHRATNPVAAGGAITRNKVGPATANSITETLS